MYNRLSWWLSGKAMQEMGDQSLGQGDPLEKEMVTHSSVLAWEITWTEASGRLQSRGVTKSWTQLSGWTEHIIHSTFVQIQRMHRVLQVALAVMNSVANAGDIRNTGSIPGSGRYLGGQYSNPLQYSCLMSPVDRGAWWITVHGVTKNCTRLRDLANTHA